MPEREAGDCGGSPLIKTVRVTFGGAVVRTFTFDVTRHTDQSMGWVSKPLAVRASASQSTIEFRSLTPGCAGPVLDAVSLTLMRGTQPPNVVPVDLTALGQRGN